jgi:DNA (cytosine-5-)-methyltransferase
MRYISLCSGVEAASLAWEPLGWKPLMFAEVAPFPAAVLSHHWPHVPNRGDMTQHGDWPDAAVELVVGGTPCQAFSVAGKRGGLSDPRGRLMLAFLDVVARYRPRWVVWENVPGVLHSGRGWDFSAFIGGLVERGYCCAWRVLDAQFFGVPQRRRRVFVVGHLGDWERAAAVLFERAGVRGHFGPRKTAGEDIATLNASRAGTQSGGMTLCMAHGQGGAEIRIDSAPTPTCNHEAPIVVNGRQDPCVSDTAFALGCQHNGTDNVLLGRHALRRLTPRECERLQGMPDDHTRIPWRGKAAEACPDGPRYTAIGNSMAVPVMRWIGMRIQQVEVAV